MDFEVWLAFVAASTTLLLIPGPTVLLVLSYAITQGRSARRYGRDDDSNQSRMELSANNWQ